MEAHKHGKRSCMNGCEQVNEACYVKCSECPSRVEKRTSPFTISVLAFQLCYFCLLFFHLYPPLLPRYTLFYKVHECTGRADEGSVALTDLI